MCMPSLGQRFTFAPRYAVSGRVMSIVYIPTAHARVCRAAVMIVMFTRTQKNNTRNFVEPVTEGTSFPILLGWFFLRCMPLLTSCLSTFRVSLQIMTGQQAKQQDEPSPAPTTGKHLFTRVLFWSETNLTSFLASEEMDFHAFFSSALLPLRTLFFVCSLHSCCSSRCALPPHGTGQKLHRYRAHGVREQRCRAGRHQHRRRTNHHLRRLQERHGARCM